MRRSPELSGAADMRGVYVLYQRHPSSFAHVEYGKQRKEAATNQQNDKFCAKYISAST